MKRLISSRNIKVVLAVVLAITCINGIGLNPNDYPIQVPDGTSSSQSKTTSTSSIPDYTGLASVVLSNGSGLDISDLPSETALSELDSLGRCGTVEMVVTPDTMPAVGERRGSIGMVKPSGWHTVRDNELVARGVRIQAQSVDGQDDELSFDVYCYNVQPGYAIDYLTGAASKD